MNKCIHLFVIGHLLVSGHYGHPDFYEEFQMLMRQIKWEIAIFVRTDEHLCVTYFYKADVCTGCVCVCSLTDVMQFGSDSVVRWTLV